MIFASRGQWLQNSYKQLHFRTFEAELQPQSVKFKKCSGFYHIFRTAADKAKAAPAKRSGGGDGAMRSGDGEGGRYAERISFSEVLTLCWMGFHSTFLNRATMEMGT